MVLRAVMLGLLLTLGAHVLLEGGIDYELLGDGMTGQLPCGSTISTLLTIVPGLAYR